MIPSTLTLAQNLSSRKAIREFHNGISRDPFLDVSPNYHFPQGRLTHPIEKAEISIIKEYVFRGTEGSWYTGENPCEVKNFIGGSWCGAINNEYHKVPARFDRQKTIFLLPASNEKDAEAAITYAHDYWRSLEWQKNTILYRQHVIRRFVVLIEHFRERIMFEIRQQIPKTRMECAKDYGEALHAASHLAGEAQRTLEGRTRPYGLVPNHEYWDAYLPAGPTTIITPMNFIWGIPVIQLVAAYLAGVPIIFKGHPFAAISNEHILRCLIAAGANPLSIQMVQGFGKDIEKIATDQRIKVVHITGSYETADLIRKKRAEGHKGGTVYNEGGGCNWAWIDKGFSEKELATIGERLAYSKFGFSSHKCTTLHGIAAPPEVLWRIRDYVKQEIATWTIEDPRKTEKQKVVGPLMVHNAETYQSILKELQEQKCRMTTFMLCPADKAYRDASHTVFPTTADITSDTRVTIAWDNKDMRSVVLATTELFMPILFFMEMDFERFLEFELTENPYEGLATSIYTRDLAKIQMARKTLGGMLKINDGTDSALEWECFGGSGTGLSGNGSAGDPSKTIHQYLRRQSGREVFF